MPEGVAKIRQRISGPFGDPRMENTGVLQSFAEPTPGGFERARELLGRTSCEPFYTGTVQHPSRRTQSINSNKYADIRVPLHPFPASGGTRQGSEPRLTRCQSLVEYQTRF